MNEHATSQRRRILIADDNRDSAESLGLLMEMEGHEVRVVNSGREALEQALEFQPEFALLDIGMPGLDGYEVARQLRAAQFEHPPKLIAITGWGQSKDKELAAASGFDVHFTKPVDLDSLLSLFQAAPDRPARMEGAAR